MTRQMRRAAFRRKLSEEFGRYWREGARYMAYRRCVKSGDFDRAIIAQLSLIDASKRVCDYMRRVERQELAQAFVARPAEQRAA